MALVINALPRKFEIKIGTQTINVNDPNSDLTPDEVKDMLVHQYPELVSGTVIGPKLTAEHQIFTMSAGKVGVKG